jgi:hypothetical protein
MLTDIGTESPALRSEIFHPFDMDAARLFMVVLVFTAICETHADEFIARFIGRNAGSAVFIAVSLHVEKSYSGRYTRKVAPSQGTPVALINPW